MNSGFVCIKVDREERPDVDDAYMAATQALSGEGGWPMSVFLTPAGRSFFAGTYFPPAPQSGRPLLSEVLDAVRDAWTERRALVEETAVDPAQALAKPLWQVRTGSVDTAVELPSEWIPCWPPQPKMPPRSWRPPRIGSMAALAPPPSSRPPRPWRF